MAIDTSKAIAKLRSMSKNTGINETRLFYACVVGTQEVGDYEDFVSFLESDPEMKAVETQVYSGDIWYRGQGK